MSTHASTKIDQKEYLKKYLSGDKGKKKKKSKKHKSKATVRIIDDDLSTLETGQQIDEDLLLGGDDAPQIVGEYIQEGPSGSEASKWRNIAVKLEEESDDDNGGGEKKVKPPTEADLWGCKASNIKIKDEFSPPRRKKGEQRQRTPDISPPRRRKVDNGRSPTRAKTERKRRSKSKDKRDKSPKRSRRSRSPNSDQSPPRKARQSPARRQRNNSSEDNSPVRRRRGDSPQRSRNRSRDQSPPRRQRKDSSDQSPPRRRNSDQSPPRRRAQSPAKSRRKRSPERISSRRRSSDQSPPMKRQPSISPARIKREKQTPDHSPQRKPKIKRESLSPPPEPQRRSRWAKAEPAKSPSPPPTHKPKASKTLEGKKAGLQNAQDMQVETAERRHREERMFAEMSNDISGRDAEVQVRSTGRRGQRARDAANEDPEVRRRKEEHEAKKKERYDRWGKGLKQVEDHRSRMAEQEYESSKPLARYSNDEDLDRHLRDQERADDPMLEYMRQKKKERQEHTKGPSLPVYQGSYPENRFGIRPGYRWDGVDRSNGYEKQWFDVQSAKRAGQEEAYKYSVEDM